MSNAAAYRTEFSRGWTIVFAAAVGTAFGISALPFYTLGVFVKPIAADTGWTRETVQLGFLAQMVGMLAVGWAYGIATDRIGARRVALWSQVGLGIGLMGIGFVGGDSRVWLAAWFMMSVLGAGTSPITWTRGIAGWFDGARGAAFGLALVGTGLTGLVAPVLLTPVIAEHGWRAGYIAMGASVILIALPVIALLFRDRPVAPGAAPAVLTGVSRGEGVRSWRFWVLLVVIGIVSFGVGGLIPNLVPMLTDHGLTPAQAAGFAGMAGLSVMTGRVVAGFLLDRFWAPAIAVAFLTLPAISCLLLAGGALPSPVLIGIAAALIGLAAGAEFDLVAFMVSRYFGMKNYGFLYSLQTLAMMFFAGIAPPIFGRIYDSAGSYDPILTAVGLGFLLSPLLLLTLGRYPTFEASARETAA